MCCNGAGQTPSFGHIEARNESDGSFDNGARTFGRDSGRGRENNPLSGDIVRGLVTRLEKQSRSLAGNAPMIAALTQAHVRRSQGLTALGKTRDKVFLARCTLSLALGSSRDESRSNMRIQNSFWKPRKGTRAAKIRHKGRQERSQRQPR